MEHVVDVMKKRYPYVEISSVVGPDSAYDNNRKVSYSRNSLNKYLTSTSFQKTSAGGIIL